MNKSLIILILWLINLNHKLKIQIIIWLNWILILQSLFIKILCSFISSRMVFLLKFILSLCGLMFPFSKRLQQVAAFLLCDAEAKFLFSTYIHQWFCEPTSQFIQLSFMSKCYDRQSELEHNSGTLCSFHKILRCFSQFASLLINHLLRHCLPNFKIKITYPKNTSSATLPPKATQSWSQSISFVISIDSLGKYWAKPKDPFDLGMIVIFSKGEAPYKNHDVTAWPHSWYATFLFSFSSSLKDCSIPARTLSEASSKSSGSMHFFCFLTAMMAA